MFLRIDSGRRLMLRSRRGGRRRSAPIEVVALIARFGGEAFDAFYVAVGPGGVEGGEGAVATAVGRPGVAGYQDDGDLGADGGGVGVGVGDHRIRHGRT